MDPLAEISLIGGACSIVAGAVAGLISSRSAVRVVQLQGKQRQAEREEDRAERQKVADAAAAATQRAELAAKMAASHAQEALAAIAENTELTRKTELSTNSMKDELLKTTAAASDLAGEKRGREGEVARRAAEDKEPQR